MEKVTGIITANYSSEALGALTKERPAASLPFGGRYRLVDFPLSNMVNAGIDTVGIVTPYKYRSLVDHVGTGKQWALDRKNGGLFLLPGTVFGVSSLDSRFLMRDIRKNKVYLNRSRAKCVLVTSCSFICNMDYTGLIKEHEASGADVTMVYTEAKKDCKYTDKLELDGDSVKNVTRGVKKGDSAFIDCFVIGREFLLKMCEWYAAIDHLDIFELLQGEYAKMDVRGYKFEGYASGVFTVDEYYKSSMDLLKPEVRTELFNYDSMIMTKVQDSVPTKYLGEAKVKNSFIPAGCVIEGEVEGSILFRGVNVQKGAVVKNSIIMQSCTIEAGVCVENAIIDRNNQISAGTVIKGTAADPLVIPKVNY